jgi:hypothetical protein
MRRSSLVETVAFLEDGLPWDALPVDVNGFVVRIEPDVDSFAVWELFSCIERRTIIPARMAKKQAVRRRFLFRFMMDGLSRWIYISFTPMQQVDLRGGGWFSWFVDDWFRSTGDQAKIFSFARIGQIE